MQDRLPAPGKANRIKITLDDGSAIEGVLSYADEAIQQGSAYNKANVLPDDVCNALGIATTSEPKDAFLANQQAVFLDGFYNKSSLLKRDDAAQLGVERSDLAATTVGDYALFGGGGDMVDAYNTGLIHTTPTPLSKARSSLAATFVGNYALFAGGNHDSGNIVDAYDNHLVHTTPTPLSVARENLAAASVGNYALFAGGETTRTSVSAVDAYDSNLILTNPKALSGGRHALAAASVGNYALFAGGRGTNDFFGVVDAYDAGLVKTTADDLSISRINLTGTSVEKYALFAGGSYGTGSKPTLVSRVDAYSTALVHTTPAELDEARTAPQATSIGGYALIAGGKKGETVSGLTEKSKIVDMYNSDLIHTLQTELSVGRYQFAATTVGDYALFGGDDVSVEVYGMTLLAAFTIPAFSAYQFEGYHSQEQYTLTEKQWESQGALIGYIKRGFRLSGYQQLD